MLLLQVKIHHLNAINVELKEAHALARHLDHARCQNPCTKRPSNLDGSAIISGGYCFTEGQVPSMIVVHGGPAYLQDVLHFGSTYNAAHVHEADQTVYSQIEHQRFMSSLHKTDKFILPVLFKLETDSFARPCLSMFLSIGGLALRSGMQAGISPLLRSRWQLVCRTDA